jgi:hypothetical protein
VHSSVVIIMAMEANVMTQVQV